MMDWAALVAMYPALNNLVQKAPGIRSHINKVLKKGDNAATASIVMHLEEIQQMEELRDYIMTANIANAKLIRPELSSSELIESWKFAMEVVETIKSMH